jgi:hypothetical protein
MDPIFVVAEIEKVNEQKPEFSPMIVLLIFPWIFWTCLHGSVPISKELQSVLKKPYRRGGPVFDTCNSGTFFFDPLRLT